jgi:excisionase family DNA binding protein
MTFVQMCGQNFLVHAATTNVRSATRPRLTEGTTRMLIHVGIRSSPVTTRSKMKPPVLLTVREAAEILGVSAPTLRRWDALGKFKARRHPMNGYRMYVEADVLRLRNAILSGRAA